jgi:rSAM/selenodomain-associated transferase 1
MTAQGRRHDDMGRGLFLIAARAPTPGMTKTRLGATIGMERAAALHAAFLVDLAARFTPCAGEDWGFDVGWAYTPAEVDFRQVLTTIGCRPPPRSAHFVPQHGEGWDVRQANLLRWGHDHGYQRTVLIGSDSPQLPFAVIPDAFSALADHEVVMGRTFDGGYYLIGMRGFHDVLSGVPMSTASAADALAARIAAGGFCLAELPETFDVDEERDLDHLRSALAPDGAPASATWAALQRLGLASPIAATAHNRCGYSRNRIGAFTATEDQAGRGIVEEK